MAKRNLVKVINPIPGSNAEYFAYDALNQTFLKRYRLCPYWAQRIHIDKDYQDETSSSIVFGQAVDLLVTEPEKFETQFIVMPRRSKEFLETGSRPDGRVEITQSEFEKMEESAKAVRANPLFAEFGAMNTQKIILVKTGDVKLKAKLDFYGESDTGIKIADLKTCQDAEWRKFRYTVAEYDYLFQMAFYRLMAKWAREAEGLPALPVSAYLIPVDQSPKAAVYHIQDELLDIEEEKITSLLDAQPWKERALQCTCSAFGRCPFFQQREMWEINETNV